jgi:hypothetical protein
MYTVVQKSFHTTFLLLKDRVLIDFAPSSIHDTATRTNMVVHG